MHSERGLQMWWQNKYIFRETNVGLSVAPHLDLLNGVLDDAKMIPNRITVMQNEWGAIRI
jgi:hypothetical protein